MPGEKAARKGDAVMFPPSHLPGSIGAAGGANGSTNVQIMGKPALRTLLDAHTCTQTTPPPPAIPGPPHGPETCFLGSLTVLINKQMAVRKGDKFVGFCGGPPNQVTIGCRSVEIGSMAFGLADPASIAAF